MDGYDHHVHGAAMEPGHIDREDYCRGGRPYSDRAGRNGARSYRPGGQEQRYTLCVAYPAPQWSPVISTGRTCWIGSSDVSPSSWPQWSPVISTGRTRSAVRVVLVVRHAAMEPGHIDREDRRPRATSRGTRTRRNGARSYRPGGLPHSAPTRPSATRRNGARSYRPGGLGVNGHTVEGVGVAAMEPGHIDREDWCGRCSDRRNGRRRNGARSYRPGGSDRTPLDGPRAMRAVAGIC